MKIFLIDDHTQERAINNFSAADKEYGRKIKELIDNLPDSFLPDEEDRMLQQLERKDANVTAKL